MRTTRRLTLGLLFTLGTLALGACADSPTAPVSAPAAEGLLEACRFLSASTRQDPGCVDCSAWLEPDSIVRYTELWATEPDMRRRVRSESFTTLLGIVESARHAAVQFDFVTSTRGLDYVEEVRGQPRGL